LPAPAKNTGPIAMKFSTADLTLLRIRCPKCHQHTDKSVTLLIRKDSVPCAHCGARISLGTPTNRILIQETAESCARIGDTLLKSLATV
jgi:DNA-directed RNA polymerase subunit RPC12/RpoP